MSRRWIPKEPPCTNRVRLGFDGLRSSSIESLSRDGTKKPEGLTEGSRGRPKGAPGRRPQRSQPRRGDGVERVDHLSAAIFSLAPSGLFWSGTRTGGSARIAFGDPRSTPGYSPRPLRGRLRQPCLEIFEGPAAYATLPGDLTPTPDRQSLPASHGQRPWLQQGVTISQSTNEAVRQFCLGDHHRACLGGGVIHG